MLRVKKEIAIELSNTNVYESVYLVIPVRTEETSLIHKLKINTDGENQLLEENPPVEGEINFVC